MAPASPRHGAIQGEASRLIGNHLAEMSGPACRVVIEPGIQPKVRADVNVRIPDLVVTCAAVDADDRLLREPLVVIEILSPSNRADTWANMWSYTAIPSVREILCCKRRTLALICCVGRKPARGRTIHWH